jgi:uncharacterized protein (UPF0332 family)
MKEEHTKEELTQYRIKKARDTVNTARQLAEKTDDGNSIANRLYYAAFYCVISLLAKEEIDYKSHKSVKTALSNFYIRTGLIDSFFGAMYGKLFDMRQGGDYEDYFDISLEKIKPYIEQVEKFIEVVEQILTENTEGVK